MFTQEEEEILKLIAAEVKAKIKLKDANDAMVLEIRSQFGTIDEDVRSQHSVLINPLTSSLRDASEALKARCLV